MFFNAFAFGIGMVALINPCGFGLLPAYLGVFLGQNDESSSRWISLNRAQGVGLAMSLGMLAVFSFFGIVLNGLEGAVASRLPYFNIALGFGLIVLGIAMLRGFQLNLKLPKMQKGGTSGSFIEMFLFGMSYATASLTCTFSLFALAVQTGTTTGGTSLGALVSYGLGMGLLATMLTLLLALGKSSLVGSFRAMLPKINFISAILLIIVGPYSIGYGVWELQLLNEIPRTGFEFLNSVNLGVADVQSSVSGWFAADMSLFGTTMTRTLWLGWPFLIINVLIIIGGFLARRSHQVDRLDLGPLSQ